MIRKVSIRGNKLTIDWDQEDADCFFLKGLQKLADDHFGGKRKVVVVPFEGAVIKSSKTVEVSDEFSTWCIEAGVNQALREMLDFYDPKKKSKVKKPKKEVK